MNQWEKPLPQRVNIVITRDTNWQAEGVIIAHNLKDALVIARSETMKQSIKDSEIAADSLSPRNDGKGEFFHWWRTKYTQRHYHL